MSWLLKDFRFGLRILSSHPRHAIASILVFALGLGLTAAVFSIIRGALKPLPFPDSERLMHLERSNPSLGIAGMSVSIHDFADWREQQTTFEDLAAFYLGTANVGSAVTRPARYSAAYITASAFELLAVKPLLGRTIQPDEDAPGSPLVALLGYGLWQKQFGGAADVVGQVVSINGEQRTVIGVMSRGFEFPVKQDLWMPLRLDPQEYPRGGGAPLHVFGKLKAGVSLEQSRAELAAIAARLAQTYPEENEGVEAVLKPYQEEFIGQRSLDLVGVMIGSVLGVLLIACANVASLLLARTSQRSKEVAIRTAMGASRMRVVTQLVVEVFILSLGGAVLGLVFATLGVKLYRYVLTFIETPYWVDIKVDPIVALFTLGLAVLATLISGILPALRATGADINEVLKEESRGSSSRRLKFLNSALVVFEITVSCGLLVAAGLMIRSVTHLKTVDYGFASKDTLTARVEMFRADYPTEESRRLFLEELQVRLEAAPGITQATLTDVLPGAQRAPLWYFMKEEESYESLRDYPITSRLVVTPGFFSKIDVELVEGREFDTRDRKDGMPVTVVNQSFAQKHFPDRSAVGERVRLGLADNPDQPWMTIVGVVPDLYVSGVLESPKAEGIYLPMAQEVTSGKAASKAVNMLVRTQGAPLDVAPGVHRVVKEIDPNLPVFAVSSLDEAINDTTWIYGVLGGLFVVFGSIALCLAIMGLYAVVAYTTNQRTLEIGIRMAFGAGTRDVLKVIYGPSARQIGLGLGLGLLLAFGLAQTLASFLFGVEPFDLFTFLGVTLVIVLTGIAACLGPALRALRIAPMQALHYE